MISDKRSQLSVEDIAERNAAFNNLVIVSTRVKTGTAKDRFKLCQKGFSKVIQHFEYTGVTSSGDSRHFKAPVKVTLQSKGMMAQFQLETCFFGPQMDPSPCLEQAQNVTEVGSDYTDTATRFLGKLGFSFTKSQISTDSKAKLFKGLLSFPLEDAEDALFGKYNHLRAVYETLCKEYDQRIPAKRPLDCFRALLLQMRNNTKIAKPWSESQLILAQSIPSALLLELDEPEDPPESAFREYSGKPKADAPFHRPILLSQVIQGQQMNTDLNPVGKRHKNILLEQPLTFGFEPIGFNPVNSFFETMPSGRFPPIPQDDEMFSDDEEISSDDESDIVSRETPSRSRPRNPDQTDNYTSNHGALAPPPGFYLGCSTDDSTTPGIGRFSEKEVQFLIEVLEGVEDDIQTTPKGLVNSNTPVRKIHSCQVRLSQLPLGIRPMEDLRPSEGSRSPFSIHIPGVSSRIPPLVDRSPDDPPNSAQTSQAQRKGKRRIYKRRLYFGDK